MQRNHNKKIHIIFDLYILAYIFWHVFNESNVLAKINTVLYELNPLQGIRLCLWPAQTFLSYYNIIY